MLPSQLYRIVGRQRRQPPTPIVTRYQMAAPARIIAGECLCHDPMCSLHPEVIVVEPLSADEIARRIGSERLQRS